MKVKIIMLISCLLVFSSSAMAASNPSKPSAKKIVSQGNDRGATACIACHGRNGEGNSVAGYPYLAGLSVSYIRNQLQAFKNNSRNNIVMQPIAKQLNDNEIALLATYYSRLTNNKITMPLSEKKGKDSVGKTLATKGKWQAGLPACFKCHGEGGSGIASDFPPVVGQPLQYIKNQLNAFHSGKRKNDPVGLMQAVVKKLEPSEMDAVAQYLSANK